MPDFIIIGARKASTSSLYLYLKNHPELYMPPYKRLRFFQRYRNPLCREEFRVTLSDYKKMSSGAKNSQKIGEVESCYLSREVAVKIKMYLPKTKIIASLRNPADRAYSEYNMQVRDGYERESFEKCLSKNKHIKGGLYYKHLKEYYKLFPKKNIKIIIHDDFCKNPVKVMQDLFDFVGVEKSFVPDMSQRLNVGAVPMNKSFARLINRPNKFRAVVARWLTYIISSDKKSS